MLIIDDDEPEAQVYRHDVTKAHTIRCMVKLSLPINGIFISGITAEPSPKHPEKGLWVQMPRYKARNKWITPLECNHSYPFWQIVYPVVVRAYDDYLSDNGLANDASIDEIIDVDDALAGFEPP